ncbi:unnamed protein product [Acidithrix sp. C25]|nr:unnamed protein product [Acidithrix sp. C25]
MVLGLIFGERGTRAVSNEHIGINLYSLQIVELIERYSKDCSRCD